MRRERVRAAELDQFNSGHKKKSSTACDKVAAYLVRPINQPIKSAIRQRLRSTAYSFKDFLIYFSRGPAAINLPERKSYTIP